MIYLWILAGAVVTAVAYFLPGHSSELWPNVNSAGIVLLVYLGMLLGVFSRRKDLTPIRRNVVLVLALIAIGATALSWHRMEDQTQWQRKALMELETTIGRGIYTATISDSLLAVLDEFHHQAGRKRSSLGEVYRRHFPPGKVGDSWSTIEATGRPNYVDDVFLTAISDTHVVLVARHPWYKGTNASFVNFADRIGTLQVRATLTEKGLDYVTEN